MSDTAWQLEMFEKAKQYTVDVQEFRCEDCGEAGRRQTP